VKPLRSIFSTTLLAIGLAIPLRAADPAPASSAAVSAPALAAPEAAGSAAPAAAKTAPAAPTKDSAKSPSASELSKPAPAAADAAARTDSTQAAAADSLKPAQTAADSAQAAQAPSVDSARADSLRRAQAQADSARTAAAKDSAAADSAVAQGKKRKRIVRETTVNTLNEMKGKYRSPKKAMFMSLIIPGLGQAYVGHSWFNYTRGAAYFLADVALAYGWHYYVGTKQNREIRKYRTFADENWRQAKYEDSVLAYKEKSKDLNTQRDSYCEAVQSRGSAKGQQLFDGCVDPASTGYASFKNEYNDADLSADSVGRLRSAFVSAEQFYELIGKDNEFITGWIDAPAMKMGDTAWYAVDDEGNVITKGTQQILATTPYQQKYVAMRAQANDYARMQAWFLGGMVVNHIVSAVDAALTARYHNKALYQTETSWYDRLHLDSRIAWEGSAPVPNVTASFTF
jgi:hypothetical protein